MQKNLLATLETIGLSDNEARVYIASLELGPSSAQHLAAKATISRPNTYIMIESLIKRGLMTSFLKGKKRQFAAEAPEKLYRLVERDLVLLESRRKAIAGVLPELSTLVGDVERPALTMGDDDESIAAVLEEFVAAAEVAGGAVLSQPSPELAARLEEASVPFRTASKGDQDAVLAVAGDTVLALDLIGSRFAAILQKKNVARAMRALIAGDAKASRASRPEKEHAIA